MRDICPSSAGRRHRRTRTSTSPPCPS